MAKLQSSQIIFKAAAILMALNGCTLKTQNCTVTALGTQPTCVVGPDLKLTDLLFSIKREDCTISAGQTQGKCSSHLGGGPQ